MLSGFARQARQDETNCGIRCIAPDSTWGLMAIFRLSAATTSGGRSCLAWAKPEEMFLGLDTSTSSLHQLTYDTYYTTYHHDSK